MQRCVQKIEVTRTRLWVRFKPTSLGLDYDDEVQSNNALIEIPVALKRCGMAMKLIINPEVQRATRKKDTTTMIALLAKTNDWFSRLKSGECKSVSELAEEDNVRGKHICKLLPLAFLSPEIQQRIMLGEHPPELNALQLIKRTPFPHDWAEQKRVLGFLHPAGKAHSPIL